MSKKLVAYFSAGGATKKAAESLAEAAGTELIRKGKVFMNTGQNKGG